MATLRVIHVAENKCPMCVGIDIKMSRTEDGGRRFEPIVIKESDICAEHKPPPLHQAESQN